MSAFTGIAKKEGPFAFYKGLTPSLILIAPQIGAVFACYEFFHDTWCATCKIFFSILPLFVKYPFVEIIFLIKYLFIFYLGPKAAGWAPLICGAMAGVCSKTLVYPLDLAKKRLQVTGFEHARKSFGEVSGALKFFGILTLIFSI